METYGVTAQACQWETVHGDMHWQNLLGPTFGLLDWELWGTGPAGTDAATLLLYSIGVPKIFETVRETFAAQLETESGRIAQLAVGARLLSRIRGGDFPELAKLLNQYLNGLGVAVT
jgi:hypothetical protein